MADKWNDDTEPEEVVTGASDERLRGVADDADEFEDTEDLDEEDEEEGSTF